MVRHLACAWLVTPDARNSWSAGPRSEVGAGARVACCRFRGLVTLLVVHRLVAFARRHSRIARIIDHPPRVLVTQGKIQDRELARAGLTAADLYALLRQQSVDDLGQVGYLLYETRGVTTVIGADGEPGPLMRDGPFAAGYRDAAEPVERHARQQHQRMLPDDGIRDSSARTRR